MTEKELSRFYWIKKEINDIENRMGELGYGVGSSKLSFMPKSQPDNTSIEERIVSKILELEHIYIDLRITALEEYLKIENFLKSVEDPELRLIMRYRFLDLKKWEEIGVLLHMDRTTVARKCRRGIKDAHKSH